MSFTLRAFDPVHDFEPVAELIAATNSHDGLDEAPSADELRHAISVGGWYEPDRDTQVAVAGDEVVGFIRVSSRVRSGVKVVHRIDGVGAIRVVVLDPPGQVRHGSVVGAAAAAVGPLGQERLDDRFGLAVERTWPPATGPFMSKAHERCSESPLQAQWMSDVHGQANLMAHAHGFGSGGDCTVAFMRLAHCDGIALGARSPVAAVNNLFGNHS